MESSIWESTLEGFRRHVASTAPVPAGVAVAAVSAALGLSLLIKVLEIASKRDPGKVRALIDAARSESDRLARYADEDVAAFRAYMADRTLRGVIEVPLRAARSALAGLDLCAEGVTLVPAAVVTDLGTAAILLAGAVRGILLSLDINARGEVIPERQELDAKAAEQLERILRQC